MKLKHSKYPIQITYDLTNYCNAKCVHCYSNSSSKRYTEFENEKEVVERVIEELVKVKPLTLIVSGGEPLLSPYFEYFIKSLYYKLGSRFPVTVIPSNSIGILVNKNSLQFLSEINKRYPGSITIYFSVHHSDPKVQEVFMGVKNIRDRLIEAINIVKSFELPFTIGMTPTKLNFNDLDNMFELSLKLGAKSFNLSEFIPIGRGKNSIDLDLDPEQYKILKYWIKKKEESYRLKGFISHHPHYAIFIRPDLWFNELYTGCTAGIYDLGIRSNGNITPCPLMNYVLGNIRNQSIIEIWNNHPLLAKLRNSFSH